MPGNRYLYGFVAGFFATLIFHQFTLAGLWQLGIAPFAPFAMKPTPPLGVPAMWSLAFWGGVWGIIYLLVHRRFPKGNGYWLGAFVFGAIAPSLVALLVVLPLKGGPVGGGWHPALLFTALMVNGAWGVGTGLFYRVLKGKA
jgi:hypothetical protein